MQQDLQRTQSDAEVSYVMPTYGITYDLEKPKIRRLGSKIGRNSKILFARIVSLFVPFSGIKINILGGIFWYTVKV